MQLFKFNSSLLRDECYSEMVRRVIRNTIIDYALPVYLPEYLVSCITCEGLSNVQFTISDFLLFEVLILNIRTETITYSIRKSKRKIRREEDTLNTSIERLEQEMSNNPDTDIAEQLSENRRKLESIREIRLRGSIQRSRVRWFEEGEKSSKYFLNLEKRNYTSKLIPCLNSENGDIVQDQFKILKLMEYHYRELFRSHDDIDNDPAEFLDSVELKQLSVSDIEHLQQPLSLEEVGRALYAMKNNKSPGSDGFPAEFYKFFWSDIKHIVWKCYCLATKLVVCQHRCGKE